MPAKSAWPELPAADWQPTRDTLILWLQVIGKIRIARAPLLNHWWNSPLYITAQGFTTSVIPTGAGRSFSIDSISSTTAWLSAPPAASRSA